MKERQVVAGIEPYLGNWQGKICVPLVHFYCRPVWILNQILGSMPAYSGVRFTTNFGLNLSHEDIGTHVDLATDALRAKSLDIIASPQYAMLPDRVAAGVPYVYPVEFYKHFIYIRRPDIDDPPETGLLLFPKSHLEDYSLVKPFDLMVWLSIGLLMLLLISLYFCTIKISTVGHQNEVPAKKIANSRTSVRILQVTILLFQMGVGVFYSSDLSASAVSSLDVRIPIRSLTDLCDGIKHFRYKLISDFRYEFRYNLLIHSHISSGKEELKEALEINPLLVLPKKAAKEEKYNNSCTLTATSRDKHYAFITSEEEAKLLCRRHLRKLWKIPTPITSTIMRTYIADPANRLLVDRLREAIMSGVHYAEEVRFNRYSCLVMRTCFSEGRAQHTQRTQRLSGAQLIKKEQLWILFTVYALTLVLAGVVHLAIFAFDKLNAMESYYH